MKCKSLCSQDRQLCWICISCAFDISLSPLTNVGPDSLQFLQLGLLDAPVGVFPKLSSVIILQLPRGITCTKTHTFTHKHRNSLNLSHIYSAGLLFFSLVPKMFSISLLLKLQILLLDMGWDGLNVFKSKSWFERLQFSNCRSRDCREWFHWVKKFPIKKSDISHNLCAKS